ncbi:MAG: alpha/beta fold hydrolase [Myxococcales bacterium]
MKRIALRQGTLEYVDVGEGPTLLFVHGVLVDHQIWSDVVERLSGSFRCIAPRFPSGCHHVPMNADADLSVRGHARLVADLLDALDVRDVTLVGNDTGGAVCQLVVAEAPPRVARLVLTDCDSFEVFPPRGFGHLVWGAKIPGLPKLLFSAMRRLPPLARLRWAYGALTFRRLDPTLLRGWIEPVAQSPEIRRDLLKLLEDAGPAITLEVAERLHRFPGRVLLLWSRDDRFFPLSLGQRLAPKFRDARLDVIDRAGLLVPLDRPDAVASGIAAFVLEDRGAQRPA